MSRETVETLNKKAASADKGDEAMKYSQAACNVANAMCALRSAEKMKD